MQWVLWRCCGSRNFSIAVVRIAAPVVYRVRCFSLPPYHNLYVTVLKLISTEFLQNLLSRFNSPPTHICANRTAIPNVYIGKSWSEAFKIVHTMLFHASCVNSVTEFHFRWAYVTTKLNVKLLWNYYENLTSSGIRDSTSHLSVTDNGRRARRAAWCT